MAVSESTAAGKGGYVLDLANGKLNTDVSGWASDVAPLAGYSVAIKSQQVVLSKGKQALSLPALKEGIITAFAVLPPLVAEVPLVALASYIPEKGTTLLELVDGSNGQTLRRYAGHTAPIRSLSFRADGKLLASTADDQTTIVWSLTDLGEVMGKHGSLGDLAVELRDKDLVVLDSAGVKGINDGDLIRGIYDKGGKLQALTTSAAFFEALWMKKPGQTVTIKVNRAGKEMDVGVPVRQGVDVRKPLFTLFFPRDAAGKVGDWLGWNAIGPYDSSRKDVEQYLGWHFNTGKADQPTSFAFIDQYRKEYFRPGLLKEMAELGDLPPPPKGPGRSPRSWCRASRWMAPCLTQTGGEFLIRKKTFELHVTIPAYEPFDGDKLSWQMDGGPERPLEPVDVNLWSANVEASAGAEPVHSVVIRMKRTPEGWPAQEYRSDVALCFVAPPPKISYEAPKTAEPIKVDKAQYPIKASFQPGEAGVTYRAWYAQESLGKKIASRMIKSDKNDDLSAMLTLEPGLT